MSSPDYSQDVKDIIDGLGDTPTPDEIYHAVRNYSVDNVVAATASAAKAGGGGGGGSQDYVIVALRHSADFSNVQGSAPVTAASGDQKPEVALTLPPSAFGNDSIIDVLVHNDTGADVVVVGGLVVQNADGTVWIEQDSSGSQTIAAGASASIDFAANEGSAGAGLSWDGTAKQVDIANAGVYSAFVSVQVLTA